MNDHTDSAREGREMNEQTVLDEIAAERHRQIDVEGWTPEHDDEHCKGEMAGAAASYARSAQRQIADMIPPGAILPLQTWRWHHEWWKPKSPRRDLIRAAALIVAEIERLDREESA